MIGYNVKIIGPETGRIIERLVKANCISFSLRPEPPEMVRLEFQSKPTAYLRIGEGDIKGSPADESVKIHFNLPPEKEDLKRLEAIIIAVKETDLQHDDVMQEFFDQVKENKVEVYLFVMSDMLKKHTTKEIFVPPIPTERYVITDDTDFKKLFSGIRFQLFGQSFMSVSPLKRSSKPRLPKTKRFFLFDHISDQSASVSALTISRNDDDDNTKEENLTTKVEAKPSSPISTQTPNSTSEENSIGGNEGSTTTTNVGNTTSVDGPKSTSEENSIGGHEGSATAANVGNTTSVSVDGPKSTVEEDGIATDWVTIDDDSDSDWDKIDLNSRSESPKP